MKESVPMLYMNGNSHAWLYQPGFLDMNNFLRVQHVGGTSEDPYRVIVEPLKYEGIFQSKSRAVTRSVFTIDRKEASLSDAKK
eukprot:14638491-Ditylum_brightwellii.AAC.1